MNGVHLLVKSLYIGTAKAIRTKTRGLSPLLTNLPYLRYVLTALVTAISRPLPNSPFSILNSQFSILPSPSIAGGAEGSGEASLVEKLG